MPALFLALAPNPALGAEATEERPRPRPAFHLESSYTLVAQDSDGDALDGDTTGSFDLFLTLAGNSDRFEAYFEGNSGLGSLGLPTRLPDVNSDAGTAVESDLSGRLQLSELKYTRLWRDERRTLSVGLLDATTLLDTASVANDENTQFLGLPFVNNPTIEFPDYTLGAAARWATRVGLPDWTVMVASTNGLADNPDRSYRELFRVGQREKGLFAAGEAAWVRGRHRIGVGAWANGAHHETLDGRRDDASNHGFYAVADMNHGRLGGTLRLGTADPEVSAAERFAAAAAQIVWGERVFGLGAAYTWISEDLQNGPRHTKHLESYASLPLTQRIHLSPSIQYVVNPGPSTDAPLQDDLVVWSLRLRHTIASID